MAFISAQEAIYKNMKLRGYTEDWTVEEFVARQVFKSLEELIELFELIRLNDEAYLNGKLSSNDGFDLTALMDKILALKKPVRDAFRKGYCGEITVEDSIAAMKEIADVAIPMFCAAETINQAHGNLFHTLEGNCVRKSAADIKRGVSLIESEVEAEEEL